MVVSLKEKLYQMFILGTGEYAHTALQNGLGGIIFFTKDIQSIEQFESLISSVKKDSIIPPFLAIDQEGGRVERTENIHHGKKYLSAKFASSAMTLTSFLRTSFSASAMMMMSVLSPT